MPNRRTLLFRGATAIAAWPQLGRAQTIVAPDQRVSLGGDGVTLPPSEYAALLTKLSSGAKADQYLKGGAVEELETRFAKLLGKEKALFFPTGTLANHVAIRLLAARTSRRVLVQEESHIYRDEGDCAQALSGLNLVPLAPGRATIRASEIVEAVDRAAEPPYPVPVGAIAIESPVRRKDGQAFDFEEMKKISAFARERRIGLHFDGARMFLASAYTGIAPASYSALFDTVYVSLYKYFNAPFGAVLAGPGALIDEAATVRHQFGGAVLRGWESAAVALHYLDGFEERFQKAARAGEDMFRRLTQKHGLEILRMDGGTNVFYLRLKSAPPEGMRDRLAARGILIRPATVKGSMVLQVNETILRRPPEEIADELAKALGTA